MHFPDQWFWIVFAAIAIYFVFNIFRRGGLKGALFNAEIVGTIGEIEASGPKLIKQVLKVHTLKRDGDRLVGVEVVSKSVASYQMLPIVLTPAQAQDLVSVLQLALHSQ